MKSTRRTFLSAAALAALGFARRPDTGLAALSIADPKRAEMPHLLVTIFLRGGLDGLSAVPPYADDAYHRSRPTLGLAAPKSGGKSTDRDIDLDGYFGLHPSLAPLLPLYRDEELAIVHACGSGDQTLSHFDAMATMERGLASDSASGAASGWLARHLNLSPAVSRSSLRAVALGDVLPQSLAGSAGATVFQNVDDLKMDLPFASKNSAVMDSVRQSYLRSLDIALRQSGAESVNLFNSLASLSPQSYVPSNGAKYPLDDLGSALRQVAMLCKGGFELEVACLNHAGYDTHVAQGGPQGILASRLNSLSRSISAFKADLGATLWAQTTVVVQSEFGRRVEENSGLGTDHGRGGVMMAMSGAGVRGGKVYAKWPGIGEGKLDPDGNLLVTTDYRNVLAEVLAKRCGNADPSRVFPGLSYKPIGLICA